MEFPGTDWSAHAPADVGSLLTALEHAERALKEERQRHDAHLDERDAARKDLAFLGAERTPEGDWRINLPKYHAAHRCDAHRETPWRTQDLDECVPCLRTRLGEAKRQRDETNERMKQAEASWQVLDKAAAGNEKRLQAELAEAEQRGRALSEELKMLLDSFGYYGHIGPSGNCYQVTLSEDVLARYRAKLAELTPGALSAPPPGA